MINRQQEGDRVHDGAFLSLVQKRGDYASQREASHAANVVFGTVKSWISPAAANELRKLLPRDAARFWQYSPVSPWSHMSHAWHNIDFPTLMLRIQQLGEYDSADAAKKAYGSVISALRELLPVNVELVIGKRFLEDGADDVAAAGTEAAAL